MKKEKGTSLKLIITLVLFIGLWLIAAETAKQSKLLMTVVVSMLSIILILKNKNTSRTDIFIGLLLGIMAISYSYVNGLATVITYIGGMSVFKTSNQKITLLKLNKKEEVLKTIILAVAIGLIIGFINFYLGKFSLTINPTFKLKWFLMSLYAGVSEEIIFRFFFFAICVWITRDKKLSKLENFLCYLIMIVPHVLLHFDRSNVNLSAIIQMSIMFGLPFALMQRKRDLSSAMGAHAIVDLIRFTVFGV